MAGDCVEPGARVCAVVDDDAAVCHSLGVLLAAHGFQVQLYRSGSAFLAGPRRRIDLLVVDQHMPGMDGLSLVEALRRDGLSIPAVLITGCPDLETERRAAQLGLPVFPKPFPAAKLLKLIGNGRTADRSH